MANACVGLRPGSEFPYLEGYRRGAQQLAQRVCAGGRDQDFLVYPIVFFYRHFVELQLKRLLILVANLAEEELDHKSRKDLDNHHIDQLWADIKRLLKTEKVRKECGVTMPQEDTQGIDSYVQQISAIDPDSQSFRYSRTKNGDTSLPETVTHINIAVFADHMESLCSYLDGLVLLGHKKSTKSMRSKAAIQVSILWSEVVPHAGHYAIGGRDLYASTRGGHP